MKLGIFINFHEMHVTDTKVLNRPLEKQILTDFFYKIAKTSTKSFYKRNLMLLNILNLSAIFNKSAVKYSIEKLVLLDNLDLCTIFCSRLSNEIYVHL